MQNSMISFEIKKVGSTERITSIEAGSFKAAIEEFARSYDFTDEDKYAVIFGDNQLEFRFVLVSSSVQKCLLSASENNHFDIYRKNKSDKIRAVLSDSEKIPEITNEIAEEDKKRNRK